MPVVPTFDVGERAPTVPMPTADPGAFAAPGQALAQVGAQIGSLGQEWEQKYVAAKQQATASGIVFDTAQKIEDLRQKWRTVPDRDQAVAGFNSDFQALQKQTMAGIQDPTVQSFVTDHLIRTGLIAGSQVGAEAFQKEASANAARLDQNSIDALNRIAGNPDPHARALEMDNFTAATQGAAAAGWITPENAQARQTAFRFKISQDDVLRDAQADPAGTVARLSDPAQRAQAYPYLPPEWADAYANRLQPRADAAAGRAIGAAALSGVGNQGGTAGPASALTPAEFQPIVAKAVEGTGIPPSLAGALFAQESGFNPKLVGSAGEVGLGQVKPGTAQQPGYGVAPIDPSLLTDPPSNARFSMQYLAGIGRSMGVTDWTDPEQVRPVLEAYNGGSGKQAYAQSVLGRAGMTPGTAPADAQDWDAARERAMHLTDNPAEQAHAIGFINQQEAQWKAATAAERTQLGHDVTDLSAALTNGVEADIPTDRIRALYPKARADEIITDLTTRSVIGSLTASARYASPDELAGVAQSLESGMGTAAGMLDQRLRKEGVDVPPADTGNTATAEYAVRQKALAVFRQVVAARQTGLATDPAGYVADEPTVAAVRGAIDPKDPASFERYARTTQAAQMRMGVPENATRVLTLAQSKAAAAHLEQADPSKTDVGAELHAMAQKYGGAYPAVWHDLVRDGGLSPDYQVLGAMAPGVDRTSMQRALQAAQQKGGEAELRKSVDPSAAQGIDQGLSSGLDDFRRTVMIPGLAGDANLYSAVQGAVRKLAYWNVMNGENGSRALDHAISAVLPYDFEGLARAPKGQGGLAADTGDRLLSGLKPDDLAAAAGGAGMADADRQAAYLRAIQRHGQWVTNERGDGWALAVQGNDGSWQMPLRKDGSRIGFRFADMKPAEPGNPGEQQAGP